MKSYWAGLQAREQRALMIASAAITLFLIYSLFIDPYLSTMQQLQNSVAMQQKDLDWMKSAAAEVKALRLNTDSHVNATDQSLISLVDGQARDAGLSKAIKQLTPSGDNVSVRLQEAEFDTLLRWLAKLDSHFGIVVNSLSIERLQEPGMVNATVVLGK